MDNGLIFPYPLWDAHVEPGMLSPISFWVLPHLLGVGVLGGAGEPIW